MFGVNMLNNVLMVNCGFCRNEECSFATQLGVGFAGEGLRVYNALANTQLESSTTWVLLERQLCFALFILFKSHFSFCCKEMHAYKQKQHFVTPATFFLTSIPHLCDKYVLNWPFMFEFSQ